MIYESGSVVSYKSSIRSHLLQKSAAALNDTDYEPFYTFESNLALAQSVYSSPIRTSSRAGSSRGRRRGGGFSSPSRPSTTSSVSSRYKDPPRSRPSTTHSYATNTYSSQQSLRSMSPASKARCDMNRLRDLSRPKLPRPKYTNNGISKNSWDFIEDHGREIPAAQYDTDQAFKKLEQSNGGKFSKSETKSDIEWKIHRARLTPAPGQYDLKGKKVSGGAFSLAKPKTDIEFRIYEAQQSPGPGSYKIDTSESSKRVGGKFDMSTPKTDLDYSITRAKNMPGPGDYKPPSYQTSGGVISSSVLKSDIDLNIQRVSKLPAGESYEPEKSYKHLESTRGGKLNPGTKPKSEFDHQIRTASQQPGPGDYHLKEGRSTYHVPVTLERKDSFSSSGKVVPFF